MLLFCNGKNGFCYKEVCDSSCEHHDGSGSKYVKQQTNADRIRAMSNEELANFLCEIAYAGEAPWCMPFSRKFCDNCPTIEGTMVETGQTMDLHECEYADGKCPHGSDVVWWLQQPAKEEGP